MNRNLRYSAVGIFIIASIILVYLLINHPLLKDTVNTIVASYIIAYSLRPIQQKMVERGLSRKLSAVVLLLGLLAGICIIIFFLVPNVIRETLNISTTFDELKVLIDKINRGIERLSSNRYMKNIIETAMVKLENFFTGYFNNAVDGLFKKTESLLSIAVIPILVYYILADGEELGKTVMGFVPLRRRRVMRNLGSDINVILSKYILSQFFLSVLISVMTFIILVILKVDFPLLLSILNGIFNIIPYFGPLLGGLPAIIVALLVSPKTALWTAICLNFIQQIEGDIIAPKITGDSINMHPLFVILLLILGGKIGGFIGMVLAVPVAVIIKVAIEDLDFYMY